MKQNKIKQMLGSLVCLEFACLGAKLVTTNESGAMYEMVTLSVNDISVFKVISVNRWSKPNLLI
jgi:hypothetical protein